MGMCCGCTGSKDRMKFTAAWATVLLALLAGQVFAEEVTEITFNGRRISMCKSRCPCPM